MDNVPVGQNVCIRSGSSAVLSCMVVKNNITTSPITYTWSPTGNGQTHSVSMAGTYVCTASNNNCGSDTAQSTVSCKS